MKAVKLLFSVIALVLQADAALAGEDFFRNKTVGGYYHYGYVWAHKPRVEHLNTGHTQGGEIFFQTQRDEPIAPSRDLAGIVATVMTRVHRARARQFGFESELGRQHNTATHKPSNRISAGRRERRS